MLQNFLNLKLDQNWQIFLLQNIIVCTISFLVCFVAMKYFLILINKYNICRQPIRNDGPESHLKEKKNTPTMGGLIIVLSTIFTSMLLLDISNFYVLISLFVLTSFSLIGFIDDFIKVKGSNTKGFRGSIKIILQFLIVSIAIVLLQIENQIYANNLVQFPFFDLSINIGQLYILFAVIVVVGAANSINLTDGLDGLVSVPMVINLSILIFIAYNVIMNETIFDKIGLFNIIILSSILIGSILAFLKYNLKPAKIFMGDVGSLGIGALLGIIAIILKIELVFFIISLLFVIEALSVILQVASFKIRKKRIFLMAPIHHHFEKMGWGEKKVVRIFWLASLIFGLIGLISY